MLPYDVICQLAHAILDGTVFEITKGLQDIQQITEKSLSERRMKIVNAHRCKEIIFHVCMYIIFIYVCTVCM